MYSVHTLYVRTYVCTLYVQCTYSVHAVYIHTVYVLGHISASTCSPLGCGPHCSATYVESGLQTKT